ncbi:hypothetical protein [uncultured Psychrobacter sp.]|uniref:hypothetical protein n=1 Tax=uncultured Psychrobacter sp. TaxID=259303 RepID=UPI0026387AFA|nr:hypothetical protein [uncultured Psychrobacter sp.]
MAKRLYVGNLNYQTTDDGLREIFGECGEVTEVTVIDGKGFGLTLLYSAITAHRRVLDNKILNTLQTP